jgi:hypothetical protein
MQEAELSIFSYFLPEKLPSRMGRTMPLSTKMLLRSTELSAGSLDGLKITGGFMKAGGLMILAISVPSVSVNSKISKLIFSEAQDE